MYLQSIMILIQYPLPEDLSEHCDDESELEPESDSADSVCPANVRDMLARK